MRFGPRLWAYCAGLAGPGAWLSPGPSTTFYHPGDFPLMPPVIARLRVLQVILARPRFGTSPVVPACPAVDGPKTDAVKMGKVRCCEVGLHKTEHAREVWCQHNQMREAGHRVSDLTRA